MAVEKVTSMMLKVDLQCPRCYKKIKKTLCKFPQIRNQVYDEKANTVAITVVCCSPEKIRDKLCAKAGKVIKSIELKEPVKGPGKPNVVVIEKPQETQKAEKPKADGKGDKPKADGKGDKPKEPEKAEKPKADGKGDKPKADGKGDKPKADAAPPAGKPAEKPKEVAAKPAETLAAKGPEPVPANGVPSVFPYCGPTYDAYAAGPCYHGYGFPPPPPQPCYEGYYGYGHAHGYGNGYGRGGHMVRSDGYFSEETPQYCSIM